MKKILFLLLLTFSLTKKSSGQIICIMCYNQNDSISSGVNNLLLNGSFENTTCTPVSFASCFCPSSAQFNCNITDWICTGGGPGTYANIIDSTFSEVSNGTRAVYFGNFYAYACSPVLFDFSCITDTLCSVIGIPAGYPSSDTSYGGTTGVSLSQTVNGLIVGNTYVLEFWAGGESDNFYFTDNGIFAVDVGFGDTLLREEPTPPLSGIGTRYIIEFKATSSSHTIKFTNWGHICTNCTELILDDARLYTLAELSPAVPSCSAVQVPVVNLASSDTAWCDKKSIDFYDMSTNNPTFWYWSFPGAIPDTSNLQNPVGINYPVIGSFPVTLVACNSAGCDTVTYNPFIFEYSALLQPPIIVNGDTLCVSQFATYQWYEAADSITVLSTNQCFVPSVDGHYYVTVTDTNGCEVSSPVITIINSVIENDNNYFVLINPNPVLNEIIVHSNTNEQLEITIYDITSRKMLHQYFSNSSSLDVQQLSKGIYLYDIRNKNWVIQKGKFVKD